MTSRASGGGKFRRFFTPPVFDDAVKTSGARMVYWMAATIAVVTTVSQLVLLALHPDDSLRFLLIVAIVWAVCLGDLIFVQRGRIAAAGWFQTLAIWVAMTMAAWTSGGLSAQSITAQLVVVALGGMLVGWRGGLAFAVLTLATVTGLGLAEAVGALPASEIAQTPATRAVTLASYLVVLAVVQLLIMRNLQGARDRAVEELDERRAAESFSDTLIDAAPAIFFVVDAEGRRLRWNRRYEELMGLDTAQFQELGVLATIREEDRPLVRQRIAEALETGASEMIARVGPPDGARDVLLSGRRLLVRGRPCVVGFGVDITDRLRAEEEIRTLNADLERRVQERTGELEEALRALESFSYSVSHDLRTPLRAINGYATIIETDHEAALDEEGRRQLHRIRECTRQMAQLIDDLLRFSRLDARQLARERVDMRELAASVWDQVVPPERREALEFELGDLPEVWGDASMLRQVWANLLDNAVKFSLLKERARVGVRTQVADGQCVFAVQDDGVGFDMRYGERLFDVFERLHGSAYEGTGIGLAICRRIVEAHGGRMWCESEEGKGSTFFFSVPDAR